jgi:hypothetical protein
MVMIPFLATGQRDIVMTDLTVDRPGIAETPYTVGVGQLQFETGFDFYKRYNGKLLYLPTTLFRTGLSRKAEVRLAMKYVMDKVEEPLFKGVSPLSAGVKFHVITQRKRRPETDILANVIIPMGNSRIQPENLGYEFLLLFENDFYPNSAITYNLGYIWDGVINGDIFTFSLCYNYLPSPKAGLFLEYFFYVPYQWPGEQGVDGGITYLLLPNLMVDLSAGHSAFEKQDNFFVSAGFSFRIIRQKGRPAVGAVRASQFSVFRNQKIITPAKITRDFSGF